MVLGDLSKIEILIKYIKEDWVCYIPVKSFKSFIPVYFTFTGSLNGESLLTINKVKTENRERHKFVFTLLEYK